MRNPPTEVDCRLLCKRPKFKQRTLKMQLSSTRIRQLKILMPNWEQVAVFDEVQTITVKSNNNQICKVQLHRQEDKKAQATKKKLTNACSIYTFVEAIRNTSSSTTVEMFSSYWRSITIWFTNSIRLCSAQHKSTVKPNSFPAQMSVMNHQIWTCRIK